MPFWRSWGGALLGASGLALAVPVGLLAVICVAAAVSSGTGFDALRQLTAGPQLPGAAGRGPAPAASLDAGLPVVPSGRSATARAAASDTVASARRDADAGGRTPSRRRRPARSARPQTPTESGTPTPPILPTTATVPSTTASGSPATPAPTPVQAVGTGVEQAVATLPAVGEVGADAVSSVVDLVGPPRVAVPSLLP